MINRTPIKDYANQVIGYIDDDPIRGIKTARDYSTFILGYYDKKKNLTIDVYRRVISKGDSLSNLIWQANSEHLAKIERAKEEQRRRREEQRKRREEKKKAEEEKKKAEKAKQAQSKKTNK